MLFCGLSLFIFRYLNIVNASMKIINRVGRNHMKPVGWKSVTSMNDLRSKLNGCCIIEVSFMIVAFTMKMTVLMNRNGTRSLTVFFFMNAVSVVLCSFSTGLVRQKRKPEMKKNSGIWKLYAHL